MQSSYPFFLISLQLKGILGCRLLWDWFRTLHGATLLVIFSLLWLLRALPCLLATHAWTRFLLDLLLNAQKDCTLDHVSCLSNVFEGCCVVLIDCVLRRWIDCRGVWEKLFQWDQMFPHYSCWQTLLATIDKNFGTLAFCRRYLDRLGEEKWVA